MINDNTSNGKPLIISTFNQPREKFQKWLKKWRSYFRMGSLFFPLLRKRGKRLSLAMVFALGYVLLGLLEPWPIKLIFDYVLFDHPHHPAFLAPMLNRFSHDRMTLLNILIVTIILIALVRGIFYFYQQLFTSKVGQQLVSDIRLDLYSHLQRLSFSFHDRRRTGDLLMRLTNDIRVIRDILLSLPIMIMSEFSLVLGMIVVMFFMDWRLTLIALTVFPVLGILLGIYQKPMKQAARKQREQEGHLASIASEVLGAIKVVQSFRREQHEVDRFNSKSKDSVRTGMRTARLEAKLRWSTGLAVAIITAVVLGVASRRVLSGALSPGDLLVFVAYMQTFTRPLRRISSMTERQARGTAAGDRILEMLRTEPKIFDRAGAVAAGRFRGEIIYEGVSFTYGKDRQEVLTDVNLRIQSGERVLIAGKTGCGKTTLVSLLPRFYDSTKGCVSIDGRDVREFTLGSLRENISLVFQEPILFAASIAENIGYGKPNATTEDIIRAAELSGIHGIISALPEGYETVLGERGGTLSGGQRQCIAIARAIIKDAPIVILDEPTSGLDHQSASLVMQALRRLMENRTVLIISHQPYIMQEASRIVVLSQGRIVDEAPASQLVTPKSYDQILKRVEPEESVS